MEKSSVDIIGLIEINPIVKLNGQGKLVEKLKNEFSDTQQKLFLSSFYCYLNYDPNKDFVIKLNDVWKWIGYGRIDDAKRVLTKNFKKDVDYRVENHFPEVAVKRLGRPKELITMTIKTFKKFCMKSRTDKADEIHDYYVKLEEVIHETLREESEEMKLKLEDKEKEFQKLEKNHKKLKMNKNYYKFNTNTPGVYAVHNLMEGENAPIKVGKYGTGEKHGLDERLTSYRTNAPCTIVDFVIQCETTKDASDLESYILKWFHNDKINEVINKPLDEIRDTSFKLINLLDISYSFLEKDDVEKFNEQPFLNFLSNNKTDFQCEICESYFASKNNLKRHLIDVHSNVELAKKCDKQIKTNFKCPICEGYYSGKESLKRHIILQHPDSNVHKLLEDMRAKQKKTDFQCSECSKYLGSTETLRNHIIVVHKDKNTDDILKNSLPSKPVTDFQCTVCDIYLYNRQCLIRHIVSLHPEVDPKELVSTGSKDDIKFINKTDFQCSECSMYLSSKTCLRRHSMLKHNIMLR